MDSFYQASAALVASNAVFTLTAWPAGIYGNYGTNPYIFSAQNLGTPAANRVIVVVVCRQQFGSAMDNGSRGVKVGGVSGVLMTLAVDSGAGSSTMDATDIFYLPQASLSDPSATSADIAVYVGDKSCNIFVGTVNTSTPTPTATNVMQGDARDPSTLQFSASPTITIPANGVGVVAYTGGSGYSNRGPVTWGDGVTVTCGHDEWDDSGNIAAAILGTATTPGTWRPWMIGADGGFSYDGTAAALAVWGP